MGNSTSTTWISAERAKKQLCVGRVALAQLVASGQIGVLALPGLPDKYNAEDVLALVEHGTRKARSMELVVA